MRELQRKEFAPIHLLAGDSIEAKIYNQETGEVLHTNTHKTDVSCTVDTSVIFQSDDMFDLKDCLGAVFGKRLDKI